MLFPERIRSIKRTDHVLEIGPGGTPHPRSDIFLELRYTDEDEFKRQRGDTDKLVTDKEVIYYDGVVMPFQDKEFDYVICSHVIEHIENVEFFLSEMMRVASRGYIEYPTICYEYLYNFRPHLNVVKWDGNTLVYLKKSEAAFNSFLSVQAFFYESLRKGHKKIVDDLKEYMFEGFEWYEPFSARKTTSIAEVMWDKVTLPDSAEKICVFGAIWQKMIFILRKVPLLVRLYHWKERLLALSLARKM